MKAEGTYTAKEVKETAMGTTFHVKRATVCGYDVEGKGGWAAGLFMRGAEWQRAM